MVFGLENVLPLMETIVSPAFSPASAAGVAVPGHCSSDATV